MNITTIQEVIFDLHDAEQSGLLRFSPDADWPQEFATANEWVREQIEKLESVECSMSETMSSAILDTDYTLTEGAAWIESHPFSIRIRRTNGGISATIYRNGEEDCDPIAEAYASETDARSDRDIPEGYRKVVIEHCVRGQDGEPLPVRILDGEKWGQDFFHLADHRADTPATYQHNDGRCPDTGRPVTYDQTFLVTSKTNEQLQEEYKC
jgi:hypothetical protein